MAHRGFPSRPRSHAGRENAAAHERLAGVPPRDMRSPLADLLRGRVDLRSHPMPVVQQGRVAGSGRGMTGYGITWVEPPPADADTRIRNTLALIAERRREYQMDE